MIKELTNEAYSILVELYKDYQAGIYTLKDAQEIAKKRIKDLRYGDENKDYFWINDMHPNMVVHPYRPDLNGKDLTDFKDYNNKKMFVEFVKVVKEQNEGYVYYMWQWEDIEDKIVPKLSFVKGFKEWGWIIGTGIYIEDVKKKIFQITQNLFIVTIIISIFIVIILYLNIRNAIRIENMRYKAEENLIKSKEKYKALVEASNDGLLMIVNGKIIYANNYLLNLLNYDKNELFNLEFKMIFNEYEKIYELIKNNINSSIETEIVTKSGSLITTLATISSININLEEGSIFIIKDLRMEKKLSSARIDEIKDDLICDLQTSQFFLYENIANFSLHDLKCTLKTSVSKIMQMMTKESFGACLVVSNDNIYTGIITDYDIRERYYNKKDQTDFFAYEIMTSPLISIYDNVIVLEAINLMQSLNISYIAVKNKNEEITGILEINELLKNQSYSSSIILNKINNADSIEELLESYQKLPYLIKSLIEIGVKAKSISRLVTNFSDKIITRVIEFGIKELGTPPVDYAFIAFGSLAREEGTLFTDQDNGIIYVNNSKRNNQSIKKYFFELGTFITDALNQIGFRYCKAGNMANNNDYNTDLDAWKKKFKLWIINSESEDMLAINIFFDSRTIYGKKELLQELKDFIYRTISENKNFLPLMARNALNTKVPVDIFGNIVINHDNIEQPGKINIKLLILPLINSIRVLSLYFGIIENNTLIRLKRLNEKEKLTAEDYTELEEAYNFIMTLRLKEEIKNVSLMDEDLLYHNLKELAGFEKMILKKALNQISLFQSKLNYYFNLRD